jgi:hypothetical protein
VNESDFWSRKARPGLTAAAYDAKLRADFERVENGVANGTPDVDYCIGGVGGKIELKYLDHPARDTTPVMTDRYGLRASQLVWAGKRAKAGGLVWLLLGTDKYIWLVDLRPSIIRERVNVMNTRELTEYASWYHNNNLSKSVLWRYCLAVLGQVH